VMGELAGVSTAPVYAPERPGELQRNALDSERAAIHLGWRPWTPLGEGIQSVLDYLRR
jgi:UDP-glucose 4-epimerase